MPALLNQRAVARDWWRTDELLAKAALGRPFRAEGRDRQLRRARWLESC